jgi:hypothetical protein
LIHSFISLQQDENFRLPEWISYAYHTLPLRYLVVAVDPRSKHSPTPILDLFRAELPDLTILEWTDSDFVTWEDLPSNATPHLIRERYIHRQRRFYEGCLTHMHGRNRTWTTLYDTDEFLVYRADGASYKTLATPASMEPSGTVLAFIHQLLTLQNRSCLEVPRLLFGTKEIDERELRTSIPPNTDIDPWRFDTLRYRFHNSIRNTENGLAKVIVNAADLAPLLPLVIRNPHRPIYQICWSPFAHDTRKSPFRLFHYLGSWEAYSFRDDSRKGAERSRDAWEFKGHSAEEVRNDMAATWLKGFYNSVGAKRAKVLLQEAGLPRTYKADNQKDWAFVGGRSYGNANQSSGKHGKFFEFLGSKNGTNRTLS